MVKRLGKLTSNLGQKRKNNQSPKTTDVSHPIETKNVIPVREYKNLEMDIITISEPKLLNILKDWEEKRGRQYQIKKNKAEKVSILISVLGIATTLWITYFTAEFKEEFWKALCFFFSVLSTLALMICIFLCIKAHGRKEENLNLDDLIKSIEKRTE